MNWKAVSRGMPCLYFCLDALLACERNPAECMNFMLIGEAFRQNCSNALVKHRLVGVAKNTFSSWIKPSDFVVSVDFNDTQVKILLEFHKEVVECGCDIGRDVESVGI